MHAIARKLVSIDLPGVGLDAGDAAVATAAEAAGAGLEGRRLDLGFGYGPGASARPVEAAPTSKFSVPMPASNALPPNRLVL